MPNRLIIVESPSKARTLAKFLGAGYTVKASMGHIRDLPKSTLGVDLDHGFRPEYLVIRGKEKQIRELREAARKADEVLLAADPDREGEAIAWHLAEALKLHDPDRIEVHEITKTAVDAALKAPRKVDRNRVFAQEARRVIDRLVGYRLSPLLWRKVRTGLSAGRVQSVAVRLVVDRENEIEAFVAVESWSLDAMLEKGESRFTARYQGRREALAASTPAAKRARKTRRAADDGDNGDQAERVELPTRADALEVMRALNFDEQGHRAEEVPPFAVEAVESSESSRSAPFPYTTSTLQQEASTRLRFSPRRTMSIAQELYEGLELGSAGPVGLITYMRTDSTRISDQARTEAAAYITESLGAKYLRTGQARQRQGQNVQDAHEAIRPTDVRRTPEQVADLLPRDQARLYELIWNRAVASQMQSAELERTTVDIEAKVGARNLELRATGQVVKFDGFLTLYQEGQDEAADDDESRRLPAMSEGEPLAKQAITSTQHFTEPPPRYSEAALVKRMEELGIGRPSTYAAILQVLQDRGYVRIEKKRLMPEDKGRVVVGFLESFFQKYVEYDFTANLEEQLDRISNNEIDWKKVLREFWIGFIGAVNDIKELRVTHVLDALNDLLAPHIFPPRADGGDPRQCPNCATGKLSLKLGRFGAFIGCSNYPECNFTRQMSPGAAGGVNGTKVLGEDPETGLEVTLRGGRFGPYLQLGEASKEKDAPKPKRAGIPKGLAPDDIDLEKALGLLALPRDVGPHPEDGEMIVAGIGRFGPYVKHGKTYANLEDGDEVMTIGLNRAVTLIAEKKLKPGKGRRFGADPGKTLGDHPDKGGPIVLKKGRYGPYVSHDGVNATLPADITPETVTLEQAVTLVDARAAAGGGKKKPARSKAEKAPKKAKAAKPQTDKPAKPQAEAKPDAASTARRPAGRKTASGKAPAKTAAAKKAAAKPARKAKAAD